MDMQNFLRNSDTIEDYIATVEREVIEDLKYHYKDCEIEKNISLSKMLNLIYTIYHAEFVFVLDEWDCPIRSLKYKEQEHIQHPHPVFQALQSILKLQDAQFYLLLYDFLYFYLQMQFL